MSLSHLVKHLFCKQPVKEPEPEPQPDIYKSKWGYHPFSYETHLKLKALHKWVFESFRKHCKLVRWCNKNEQRPPEQPEYDPQFTIVIPSDESMYGRWGRMAQYQKDLETGAHEIKTIDDKYNRHPETGEGFAIFEHAWDIVVDFRTSRMPAETPDDVEMPVLTAKEIDELYEEIILNRG